RRVLFRSGRLHACGRRGTGQRLVIATLSFRAPSVSEGSLTPRSRSGLGPIHPAVKEPPMSRFCLLSAACSLLLAGCGSAASVSGTVTLKGQPLPSGTVLFHGADGRVEHALITEKGKY